MTLHSNYGGEVESIYCGAIRQDVIALDGGKQVQTRMGMGIEVKPGFFELAPKECPLVYPAASRAVGDFAVCNNCTYSTVASDSIVEC